jgi:hypothetical protein
MTKKLERFSIGGNSHLKKALVEETGIRLHSENTITGYYYLRANKAISSTLIGGVDKDPTHFQLPEQYTEAVQAVKEFLGQNRFEKGKWYCADLSPNYLLRYSHQEANKVFYSERYWSTETNYTNESRDNYFTTASEIYRTIRPATQDDIKEVLEGIARYKGLLSGGIIKDVTGGVYRDYTLGDLRTSQDGEALWVEITDSKGLNDGIFLYKDGVWAERIVEKIELPTPGKTREDVEELKRNWCKDPCWDLPTTEGFEEYREELTQFSNRMEEKWEREYKDQMKAEAESMGLKFPEQLPLFNTIKSMQLNIKELERKMEVIHYS